MGIGERYWINLGLLLFLSFELAFLGLWNGLDSTTTVPLLTISAISALSTALILFIGRGLKLFAPPVEPEQNTTTTYKILQASLDGIITVDENEQIVEFNHAAETIFGFTAEEAKQQSLVNLIIPGHLREQHKAAFRRFIRTGESHIIGTRIEVPAVRSNGEEFPVEMTLTTVKQDGKILITAFLRDLTEKKQAEEQAKVAYTVFSKAKDGIMVTNGHNQIKAVNPAFSKITGYSESEVIGKNPSVMSSGHHEPAFYEGLWGALKEKGLWEGEVWNRRKNGDIYPQWLSIAVVKDSGGRVTDHVAILTDITQRKEDEEQIIHQATHDPLTSLPNRPLFYDRLKQAMALNRREERALAVLFIDLDGFKPVNDTYGHLTGDKLLKEVSSRLSHAVRETDTISRFGGDEFAVVLPNTEVNNHSEFIAEKLLNLVKAPYLIDGKQLTIGCSIGIAIYPKDTESAERLLACADIAMYRAKSMGGNTYQHYENSPENEKLVDEGLLPHSY